MSWKWKLKIKRTLSDVVADIRSFGDVAASTENNRNVSENEQYSYVTEGKKWDIRIK